MENTEVNIIIPARTSPVSRISGYYSCRIPPITSLAVLREDDSDADHEPSMN